MPKHDGRRRIAVTGALVILTAVTVRAGENGPKSFAKTWVGRQVVISAPMYTLVYNERGKLGNKHTGRRDGLTVVTPFDGAYLQFDGRDNEDDIVAKDPQALANAVARTYQRDQPLDLGAYQKVEPVMVVRYDQGVELTVRNVRIEERSVRLFLVDMSEPDEVATALTIRWPTLLSRSLSERNEIDRLIRTFVRER